MATETESSKIPAGPAGDYAAGGANPAALSVEQMARALGLPAEKVREHVTAGAPTAAGGTINLIHYAAWLNKQMALGDAD